MNNLELPDTWSYYHNLTTVVGCSYEAKKKNIMFTKKMTQNMLPKIGYYLLKS